MAQNYLLIFLQMFVTLPLMSLWFCWCFTEQTSSLVFQRVACDAIHLIQYHNSMRSPDLLGLIFGGTDSSPHFRSRHFGSVCNCNMNFITSCLLVFLSCSVEACLLEVQSLSAFLLPINMLLCQTNPTSVSVCFLCEVTCTSPGMD